MKKTDTKTNVLLTDDPALVRAAAAQNRPVVYYERPGAEAVYEADYTVQSLDELDELFFQRVYERHYGLPWCIGETEQLKIRESTEEDVEKLLAFLRMRKPGAGSLREKESFFLRRSSGKN